MADLKEINLKIKGSNRPATAWFDEQQRQYNAFVPAAKVVDGSGMSYENPSVQAHMSTFDENGDLVGVDAYGYGAEGGFYPTPWPTKQDSIYNANAAKQYAPQVFNQVKKKQIGGLMNYSQYLQQGGGIENQIAQLVQAALSGDQQANSQIEQIMQAAQKGDKQAQQIAQMIQQIAQQLQGEQGESAQTEAMKCGGKMRAKVKKAACGKKMQMGAEIKKSKKVCACQLKKVGGKLIEVDGCTGLPIHRNGGSINKFQPGGELTFWQRYSQTKPMSIQEFARTYLSDQAIGNAIKRGWNAADKYLNENVFTGSFWQNDPSKPVQQVTPNERASMNGAGNQPLTQEEVNQAIAQRREGSVKIQPTTIQIAGSLNNESTVTPGHQTKTKAEADTAASRAASSFGAGLAGTRGGLTYDQALARQKEMLNAQGFNAQLRGRNNGADGIWGNTSQSEWNRYQQWKQDQAAAQVAAQEEQRRQAAATYGNDMTNQQLLDYDPNASGAQALGTEAAARRQKLLDAQQERKNALIFNGTQYEDEAAYNAAVDQHNQERKQLEARINEDTRNKFNQRAIGANYYAGITNGIKERRDRAFRNAAAMYDGTLNVQDLSSRDFRDLQRQLKRGKNRGLYSTEEEQRAYYRSPISYMPNLSSHYSGPSALSQEQLAAKTFKQGGSLTYVQFLGL